MNRMHSTTRKVVHCSSNQYIQCCCCSLAKSCLFARNRLWQARFPCPSLSPRVFSNSWPLSQWYYPTISFSVAPFSSCPQSFPTSGSFPMRELFTSGSQSMGASASFLPMNIQNLFPLGLTDLISLQSKRLSKVFSSTTIQRHQLSGTQPSLWSNSHIHTWLLEKSQFWVHGLLSAKLHLCFLMHYLCFSIDRNFYNFPSKEQISFNFMAVVTVLSDFESQEIKPVIVSIVSPSICHEVIKLEAMIFILWMLSFKPAFSLSLLPSSRGSLVPLHFLPLEW